MWRTLLLALGALSVCCAVPLAQRRAGLIAADAETPGQPPDYRYRQRLGQIVSVLREARAEVQALAQAIVEDPASPYVSYDTSITEDDEFLCDVELLDLAVTLTTDYADCDYVTAGIYQDDIDDDYPATYLASDDPDGASGVRMVPRH